MTDRKEYMRELMRKKRANKTANKSVNKPESVSNPVSIYHPDVPVGLFDGHGRGVPVKGYVLVSLRSSIEGKPEQAVVTKQTWRERLDKVCAHALAGWSCKVCLPR